MWLVDYVSRLRKVAEKARPPVEKKRRPRLIFPLEKDMGFGF
jgi:hypothetical protein